jgi:NTE family protein
VAKKVGLALGGGGARGWAHIGVLRALEENDIPIDCIAGTSIGALVGAIYVHDKLDELEQFANEIEVSNLVSLMDISFPGLGLIDGHRVQEFLSGYLVDATVENCRIPFRCVATNFLMKEEVVFESGAMVDAVRASISIPGVFVPFKQDKTYLVDGGVINPVPVNILQKMGADVAIAVNLNHDPKTAEPPKRSAAEVKEADKSESDNEQSTHDDTSQEEEQQLLQRLTTRYENLKAVLEDQVNEWMPDSQTGLNIFDVLGNSINMMEQQVTRVRLATDVPDVLIEPDLIEFGIFDFQQPKPMMQRGYDAAIAKMSEIKAAIAD